MYALRDFQSEYGKVASIYGGGRTTLGQWSSEEPTNTSGLDISPRNLSSPVFALFITGRFVVIGPYVSALHGPSIGHFSAGRIVFDQSGRLRHVQLWRRQKVATPAFGPALDGR